MGVCVRGWGLSPQCSKRKSYGTYLIKGRCSTFNKKKMSLLSDGLVITGYWEGWTGHRSKLTLVFFCMKWLPSTLEPAFSHWTAQTFSTKQWPVVFDTWYLEEKILKKKGEPSYFFSEDKWWSSILEVLYDLWLQDMHRTHVFQAKCWSDGAQTAQSVYYIALE